MCGVGVPWVQMQSVPVKQPGRQASGLRMPRNETTGPACAAVGVRVGVIVFVKVTVRVDVLVGDEVGVREGEAVRVNVALPVTDAV